MAVLSKLESQARDMIDAVAKSPTLGLKERAVCNVFWIQWQCSLTVERIQAIAAVVCHETRDLQSACTILTRAGLLRSRICEGARHYELNFQQ